MEQRTVREFVEDMVSDGRNLEQIFIVASQTKHKNFKEEIEKEYCRLVK